MRRENRKHSDFQPQFCIRRLGRGGESLRAPRSSWLLCGARIISWLHFTQSFITFSNKFDNWRCCHEQSQLSKFVVASIMINCCSYCEEEMIEALLSAYITLLEYSRPSPTFHYCCITVWYGVAVLWSYNEVSCLTIRLRQNRRNLTSPHKTLCT